VADLTRTIPARNDQDLTGSQFAQYVSRMSPHERESAILDEILKGNIPEFLRKLVPVKLRSQLPSGKVLEATIFVAPDYLAIGSDDDFLRIPMNLHTAAAIAERFGFLLPTKKFNSKDALQGRAVGLVTPIVQCHTASQISPSRCLDAVGHFRDANSRSADEAI